MTKPSSDMGRESLFQQLAAATALDGRCEPLSEAAQREAAALKTIDLPRLQLPAVSRPARPPWPRLLALVAALALATFAAYRTVDRKAQSDDGYRVKGAASVKLYWERGGASHPFTGSDRLVNGDRVLAEVLAGGEAVAFWGTFNRSGDMLDGWEAMRGSRLELAPGKRRSFPASLQLVGANEGETSVVLLCPKTAEVPWGLMPAAVHNATIKDQINFSIGPCLGWRFKLR